VKNREKNPKKKALKRNHHQEEGPPLSSPEKAAENGM